LGYAIRQLNALGENAAGKTLFIRGGTYQLPRNSDFRENHRTADVTLTASGRVMRGGWNPITIRSMPGETAILSAELSTTNSGHKVVDSHTALFYIYGENILLEDLTFTNLRIELGKKSDNPRIARLSKNITINKVIFKDYTLDVSNVGSGIQNGPTGPAVLRMPNVSDIEITNSSFERINTIQVPTSCETWNGQRQGARGIVAKYGSNNVKIHRNVFTDIAGDAILMGQRGVTDSGDRRSSNWEIANNIFKISDPVRAIRENNPGLGLGESAIDVHQVQNVRISSNYFSGYRRAYDRKRNENDCQPGTSGHKRGAALYVKNNADSVLIEKNYFDDNEVCILIAGGSGMIISNIKVENNFCYRPFYTDRLSSSGEVIGANPEGIGILITSHAQTPDVKNVKIYNNTIRNLDSRNILINIVNRPDDVQIINNLLVLGQLRVSGDELGVLANFRLVSNNAYVSISHTGSGNLGRWRLRTGDINSLVFENLDSPTLELLQSTLSRDHFREITIIKPRSSSALINAGLGTIGVEFDFQGQARAIVSPTIGAIER